MSHRNPEWQKQNLDRKKNIFPHSQTQNPPNEEEYCDAKWVSNPFARNSPFDYGPFFVPLRAPFIRWSVRSARIGYVGLQWRVWWKSWKSLVFFFFRWEVMENLNVSGSNEGHRGEFTSKYIFDGDEGATRVWRINNLSPGCDPLRMGQLFSGERDVYSGGSFWK